MSAKSVTCRRPDQVPNCPPPPTFGYHILPCAARPIEVQPASAENDRLLE
jgi:hypothetical protein